MRAYNHMEQIKPQKSHAKHTNVHENLIIVKNECPCYKNR